MKPYSVRKIVIVWRNYWLNIQLMIIIIQKSDRCREREKDYWNLLLIKTPISKKYNVLCIFLLFSMLKYRIKQFWIVCNFLVKCSSVWIKRKTNEFIVSNLCLIFFNSEYVQFILKRCTQCVFKWPCRVIMFKNVDYYFMTVNQNYKK